MGTRSLQLLLAEDDESFARTAARVLRPHTVAHVATIRSLRSRAAGRFDGLVLDVCLPDGRALEVVDELRAAGDARPMVYLTGGTDDDRDTVSRAAGQGAAVVFKIEGWHKHLCAVVSRWASAADAADTSEVIRRRAARSGCTASEIEVLMLRAEGLSMAEIAARGSRRPSTIKTLSERAAARSGRSNVTELFRD